MNEFGKYTEKLKSGGELVITHNGWSISYYFFGPDFRHSGEHITIDSNDIDKYINAYESNFSKYKSLKDTIPSGGEFKTIGECQMNIGVGQYYDGVTISQWYNHLYPSSFPIRNEEQLQQVVDDYEYCKRKAKEISLLLFEE